MEYRFLEEDNVYSQPKLLQLYYRKAQLEEKNLTYTVELDGRNTSPLFGRRMRKVVFADVAEEETVMIEDIDLGSRHTPNQTIFLYRYEKDGNKTLVGEAMDPETRGEFKGYWLQREHTVFVLTEARNPTFFLRVRVFSLESNGTIMFNQSRSYMAIVRRQSEVPLAWQKDRITGGGTIFTKVQKRTVINVSVLDKEREGFSFRLHESTQWGTLHFVDSRFTPPAPTLVRRGSVVYVPPTVGDSDGNTTLSFHYRSEGGTGWTYPVQDNFVLLLDDGGVTFSDPITVHITVGDDWSTQFSQATLPENMQNVAVPALLLVMGCVIAVAITSWRRVQPPRYSSIPTGATRR